MKVQIAEFALKEERDVRWAGQRARLLGSLAKLPQRRLTCFGRAVREIAQNVLVHAGSGTVTFAIAVEDGRHLIEAIVRDRGPGIKNVEQLLGEDLRGEGAGGGIRYAKTLVDVLSVDSSADSGAAVRLAVVLPEADQSLVEAAATEWSTLLAARTTKSAISSSKTQIRKLTAKLQEAQQRGVDLERELQEIKSLNETLELLALVASKTDNAVIILDAHWAVEWVNDGFARITGYELSEVRGKPVTEVLHGPTADAGKNRDVYGALRTGHGVSQEILTQRKDGQHYWASVSITPVFDEKGDTTRWICIADDVTRRRQVQEELQKAKESAEAASRAKSDFLANVSHEIRTPMNAIIGMTDLALDTELTGEQREYLLTAKESAESLLCLLNDILDLSKIEAGKLELESFELDLAQSLESVCKPLAVHAKRKGLALRTSIESDVPRVVIGDPTRLQQILTNLAGNAIKFTARGEVAVRIATQWRTSEKVGLHFSVRDTGIGIPASKLQTIFDAFTQADGSTTRRYGGTGLGLAICSQLIQLMGGRMWVESDVGKGSTFHFSAPFGLLQKASQRLPRDPPGAELRLGRQAKRSLRVLVADDSPANRMLAARVLEKGGHRVTQASNGKEVLAAVAEEAFDVLVMDVQMPEMDGFESTAVIREREKTTGGRLPIIAVTAYAMKGDRERCLNLGMDAYISKPLRARELRALVERLGAGDEAKIPGETGSPARPDDVRFDQALARLEGDSEILKEQMEYFLKDSPQLLLDIKTAVSHKDANALFIAAHRLKGLAGGFDAHQLAAEASHLEQMGKTGDLTEARSACQYLDVLLGGLRNAMQQHLAAKQLADG